MRIVLTGGAGYIGSHTALMLLEQGHDVIIIDNLSNSKVLVLDRIESLCGKRPTFYEADVCDKNALHTIFAKESSTSSVDAVIHFAGYKAVGESVAKPLAYYQNNLISTLALVEVMAQYHCKNIVFSSSATVYGTPSTVPIVESMPTGIVTNPYGRTKLMIEEMLTDIQKTDPSWNVTLLRYFNPVGAHPSGLMGEDPLGIPNNLVPYIAQVAVGKLPQLMVFGGDYDTPDGTGVRDFIHVMDLAAGHLAAIEKLSGKTGLYIYNLGTGKGYSVLDAHAAFERACGHGIPYTIAPRRAGDIAACYADPQKAADELGWQAVRNLDDMMRDSWNWQQKNPQGYAD
ncbi:MAG: UDP-glucose 4-epimerase GalE [Pseudomonadota bacterium]